MSDVTIYHNPNCGTSCNVLNFIKNAGIEPTIIYYLETPPDEKTLQRLLKQMGMTPRELLRKNVDPYAELKIETTEYNDETLIRLMVEHPLLINRPIVVTRHSTKLCRPSETVLPLLETALS